MLSLKMLDLNFCVRVGVKTLVLKTKEKCVRLRACALLYEKGKKKSVWFLMPICMVLGM